MNISFAEYEIGRAAIFVRKKRKTTHIRGRWRGPTKTLNARKISMHHVVLSDTCH